MISPQAPMIPTPLRNEYINIPAGKPTNAYNKPPLELYMNPNYKIEYTPLRKAVDHINKTSMYHDILYEDINPEKEEGSNRTAKRYFNNPSSAVKQLIQNGPQDESLAKEIGVTSYLGKRIVHQPSGLNLFVENNNVPEGKRSCKKMSSYSLEKNPYKWGVDVFTYNLPPPRRTQRFEDNLSPNLVPNTCDEVIIPRKKYFYDTQLDVTLCPIRDDHAKIKCKKTLAAHESTLDINYVPKNTEHIKSMFTKIDVPGQLNTDLIPFAEEARKTIFVDSAPRNKMCSISFGTCEPEPFKPGKRVGYPLSQINNTAYLF